MLSYTLLYLFYFIVPGYAAAHALGVGRLALLLCLPLSYLLLVVNLGAAKFSGYSINFFIWVLNLQILFIIFGLLWRRRNRNDSLVQVISRTGDTALRWIVGCKEQAYITGFLFASLIVYLYWVGPYTEVPADFWSHIGSMQANYLSLTERQVFPAATDWQGLIGKQAGYWYGIQAFLCYFAGISIEQSFAPQAMISSLIILFAIYVFTLRILRGSNMPDRARYIIAAIATCFFLTSFGVNVFSFVRYYTFAPAFINYVIYLIFTVLMLDFLGRSVYPKPFYAILLLTLLGTMAVIHLQEATFAVVLGIAMISYTWFRVSVLESDHVQGSGPGSFNLGRRQLDWVFYLTVALLAIAILAVRIKLQRHDPLAFNRMIDLSEVLPFTRHMFILNPQLQFYEMLTPWGFLVLALFVFHWRRFAANPALVAGMLSPFYTVLNPVFTDFFLRFSWPELIWRYLYMAPFAIVAAIIVYQCGRYIATKQHLFKMAYGLVVILLLTVLLFPLDTKYFYSPYSRYQTLKPVSAGNDHRVWQDLYAYLGTLDNQYNVLTDPVTGYTVRALSRHKYSGAKFHAIDWGGFRRFKFKNYSLGKYRKYDGWLFIINQRDGSLSETGKTSRHWHVAQLQVHRYYPGKLLDFVKKNPEAFKELWTQDGISVYKISIDA